MKVAFFLTLKADVVYLPIDATMRQALERMEHHRYTAVPVLDHEGRYVGTLTEGDLLWKLKHSPAMTIDQTETYRVSDVPRHVINHPVHIDAEMEELLTKALDQNFVPVVDSRDVFIGIVRRRDLIQYCLRLVQEQRTRPRDQPHDHPHDHHDHADQHGAQRGLLPLGGDHASVRELHPAGTATEAST